MTNTRTARMNPTVLARIEAGPFHDSFTPAIAHETWAELQDLIERYTSHLEDPDDVDSEERAHHAKIEKAWQDHVAGGPKPRATKAPDFEAKRDEARHMARAVYLKANEVRKRYDALATDPTILRQHRAAMLDAYAGMRADALAKLDAAQAAFSTWSSMTTRLYASTVRLGILSEAAQHAVEHRRRTAGEAPPVNWDTARGPLSSSDPLRNGEWLTRDEADLSGEYPAIVRELHASYGHGTTEYRALARREHEEGFTVSSHTRRADRR